MLQVFNLPRAGTRMFLQLQQQVGNFMEVTFSRWI